MKAAQVLLQALVNAGVNCLFTNPGTSEIEFVAGFDQVEGLDVMLTLFEGVATGAADGYARMTGQPAATLLHVAPGLAHGLGNLHNGKRAGSPIVNIIGEYSRIHKQHDPALSCDLESMAALVSNWVKTCHDPDEIVTDCFEAVGATLCPPGSISTLLVPMDVARSECATPVPEPKHLRQTRPLDEAKIDSIAELLRGREPVALYLAGQATSADPLACAARIAQVYEVPVFHATLCARLSRGAGRAKAERYPYYLNDVQQTLKGVKHLVCMGGGAPVALFAYPGESGLLLPPTCQVHTLVDEGQDVGLALQALGEALDVSPDRAFPCYALEPPGLPNGQLDGMNIALAIAALMPEHAIISDESVTSGFMAMSLSESCPPHDWLCLAGGCLGQGLPVGIGAAVAYPDRKVICLEGDGSIMYTVQSLWTIAREQLDITVVVFVNRNYAILQFEYANATGSNELGPIARDMLNIADPDIDYSALAIGMGINACRVTDLGGFIKEFGAAMANHGPRLIEVILEA